MYHLEKRADGITARNRRRRSISAAQKFQVDGARITVPES
jgi:hypothetical protein